MSVFWLKSGSTGKYQHSVLGVPRELPHPLVFSCTPLLSSRYRFTTVQESKVETKCGHWTGGFVVRRKVHTLLHSTAFWNHRQSTRSLYNRTIWRSSFVKYFVKKTCVYKGMCSCLFSWGLFIPWDYFIGLVLHKMKLAQEGLVNFWN